MPLHTALRKAKQLADWHTALPAQAALADFMDDGLLAQHLRRMRRIYNERHDYIIEVLTRDLDSRLSALPSAGGLHLTALLDCGEPARDIGVADRARSKGVAVLPLSYHYQTRAPQAGLLLGYGAIASDQIEEGLRRLHLCL
jgi:GntR family transcriptional regulator/MocR family aminotransferase